MQFQYEISWTLLCIHDNYYLLFLQNNYVQFYQRNSANVSYNYSLFNLPWLLQLHILLYSGHLLTSIFKFLSIAELKKIIKKIGKKVIHIIIYISLTSWQQNVQKLLLNHLIFECSNLQKQSDSRYAGHMLESKSMGVILQKKGKEMLKKGKILEN